MRSSDSMKYSDLRRCAQEFRRILAPSNIEFSCRPESDRYAPVQRTALSFNKLNPRRTTATICYAQIGFKGSFLDSVVLPNPYSQATAKSNDIRSVDLISSPIIRAFFALRYATNPSFYDER